MGFSKLINDHTGFDPTTRMLNKRAFLKYINKLEKKGTTFSLIYFNIDSYGTLKDRIGNTACNHLVKEVGGRIKEYYGTDGFVGRNEESEVMVVIERHHDKNKLIDIANIIKKMFSKPIEIEDVDPNIDIKPHKLNSNNGTISLSVSVGIAVFPYHDRTSMGVLDVAKEACFVAKTKGAGNIVYSDASPFLL